MNEKEQILLNIKELEAKVAELREHVNSVKIETDPNLPFIPDDDTPYWYLDSTGEPRKAEAVNLPSGKARLSAPQQRELRQKRTEIGNVYRTVGEAASARDRRVLYENLRKFSGYHKPDPSKPNTLYLIKYSHHDRELYVTQSVNTHIGPAPMVYFKDKATGESALKMLGAYDKDLLKP